MKLEAEPAAERHVTAGWRRWLARARGRWLGIMLSVVITLAMLAPDPGFLPVLRLASFDLYQLWFPRERRSKDVVIVEVDDKSLQRVSQWPWPRDILARLVERIAARRPAAIAIDIIFAEPDRTSPENIARELRGRDPVLAAHLDRMPRNDEIFADAISRAPVVLAAVAVDDPKSPAPPFAPSRVGNPRPRLLHFAGAFLSLPRIDQAATGRGLLNVEPERGIVRRIPIVAYIGEAPVLTLALESIRIAERAPFFTLKLDDEDRVHVGLGRHEATAQADGTAWLHFSPHDRGRFVSAADVLDGIDPPGLIEGKIVLLGVGALALLDQQTTPRGEGMSGVEVHAQLIENVLDRTLLWRPTWAPFVEALGFALVAALMVFLVPHAQPRRAFIILLACCVLIGGAGIAAFAWGRMLFDPLTPIAAWFAVYGLMLAATLVATDLDRRKLTLNLQVQREAAARVTGELEAARRIQMGILPTRESALVDERRVEIFAYMKAAREVGGDLYDFFSLPNEKFFVMEGDVSGKGLPAAMFMAVSKAVAKSCALRMGDGAAEMMRTFNLEISRENPEQMFVTMVVLVIDLRTGEVEYCNAGHEPPVLVRRSGGTVILDDAGGPPLCVADDYPYEAARARLEPLDVLALASDGLTEAMNRDQALYGRARLKALLESPERRGVDLTVLGNEILAGVKRFEGSAEPTDDQTLVLVSWRQR